MGNCCSTIDCKDSTRDTRPQTPAVSALAVGQQANGGVGGGANANASLKPVEQREKPPQQLQANENGVEIVKDPLAADPALSSSSETQQSDNQQQPQSQQRSPSTKSVASGRSQPEGPGPTHSLQIGDYNLRYSYYSKRGYYPEGTFLLPLGHHTLCYS